MHRSAQEYHYCREVHAGYRKLVFDGSTDHYNCITEHEDFKAVVKNGVCLLAGIKDKEWESKLEFVTMSI